MSSHLLWVTRTLNFIPPKRNSVYESLVVIEDVPTEDLFAHFPQSGAIVATSYHGYRAVKSLLTEAHTLFTLGNYEKNQSHHGVFNAKTFVDMLIPILPKGVPVYWVSGATTRFDVAKGLIAKGFSATQLIVYRQKMQTKVSKELEALLKHGGISYVELSSTLAVDGFLYIAKRLGLKKWPIPLFKSAYISSYYEKNS